MTNKHQDDLMRNMRNLVQDYVDKMEYTADIDGDMEYTGHEEVNRIMLMVDNADGNEKWRLTNIILEATSIPYKEEAELNGIPLL